MSCTSYVLHIYICHRQHQMPPHQMLHDTLVEEKAAPLTTPHNQLQDIMQHSLSSIHVESHVRSLVTSSRSPIFQKQKMWCRQKQVFYKSNNTITNQKHFTNMDETKNITFHEHGRNEKPNRCLVMHNQSTCITYTHLKEPLF